MNNMSVFNNVQSGKGDTQVLGTFDSLESLLNVMQERYKDCGLEVEEFTDSTGYYVGKDNKDIRITVYDNTVLITSAYLPVDLRGKGIFTFLLSGLCCLISINKLDNLIVSGIRPYHAKFYTDLGLKVKLGGINGPLSAVCKLDKGDRVVTEHDLVQRILDYKSFGVGGSEFRKELDALKQYKDDYEKLQTEMLKLVKKYNL